MGPTFFHLIIDLFMHNTEIKVSNETGGQDRMVHPKAALTTALIRFCSSTLSVYAK